MPLGVYISRPLELRTDKDAVLPSIGGWVEGGRILGLCYCPDYDAAGAAGGILRSNNLLKDTSHHHVPQM